MIWYHTHIYIRAFKPPSYPKFWDFPFLVKCWNARKLWCGSTARDVADGFQAALKGGLISWSGHTINNIVHTISSSSSSSSSAAASSSPSPSKKSGMLPIPFWSQFFSSWSSSIRTCDFKKQGKALWTHFFSSPNWDLIHVTSTHLHHRHTTTTNQNKHLQITKSGWVATPSSRSSRILDYRCICPAATACEAVLGWWVLMLQQWGKLSWNLWNIYLFNGSWTHSAAFSSAQLRFGPLSFLSIYSFSWRLTWLGHGKRT